MTLTRISLLTGSLLVLLIAFFLFITGRMDMQGLAARLGLADPPEPAAVSVMREEVGDWLLACPEEPEAGTCILLQNHVVEGQRRVLLVQLRPNDGEGARLMLTTPANIDREAGLMLNIEGLNASQLKLGTCTGDECQTSANLTGNALRNMLSATQGVVSYRLAGGQQVNIALSFNGLAEAFERAR